MISRSAFFLRPVALAAALALGPLLSAAGALAATAVRVDAPHTSATFSVKHLTISTVSGKIGVKSVALVLGDGNLPSSVDVVLDLATIDTQETDRDSDLRSDHWFDVAKYPEMTFKSTKITPGPNGTFQIDGNLTFHGVTNPVSLAGTYNGSIKDQHGTHFGYTATGVVDRTKWGLAQNFPPALVGNDVTITVQVEAIAL